MPFKSQAQRTWMAINKPKLYKKWTKKYGSKIRPKKGGKRKKRSKRRKKKKFSWE